MSKSKLVARTPKHNPEAAAAELATRRARTLLVLEASKAAITSYCEIITRECDAALSLLEQLEPFAHGGELPEIAVRFAEALRLRMSSDEKTRERGFKGFDELVSGDLKNVELADAAVLETFAQAVGVCETPIEISLRRIRDQISAVQPAGADYMRGVEAAFRAPLGGVQSHSATLGVHDDESDLAVIASYKQEQWLLLALEACKRQRGESAQQKAVGHA